MKIRHPLLICIVFLGCQSQQQNSEIKRQPISTENAPAAIGPYSQAVGFGQTLYLSGQIAIDPETGEIVDGGIQEQTDQAMKNLKAVLQASGYTMNDVVQCQIFLSDLDNYALMNDIYAKYFDVPPPARAVVQAARIPRDALVEIMMIANKSK